jgi:pseudouridine synthase
LKAGIALEDGLARFDSFRVVDANKSDALVEVVLHEGRHRIVRRVFEELDMPVKNLIRTAVGPITLGDMKPGHLRRLSHTELRSLRSAAGM